MTVTILQGDVRERLRGLADESINCVVTSPPYWGLRDYGVEGQIGLEGTLQEHLDLLVDVFREVRRVLRKDGTCWINYGDAYSGGGRGGNPGDSPFQKQKSNAGSLSVRGVRRDAFKPKDRMLLPARLAIALCDDGWWLRDEIVWHKPNPMPVSVTDRTTPAHEMLYMFSKSPRYHYDMKAVKEPITESSRKRLSQPRVHEQKGGEKQDAYEALGITGGSRRPNEIVSALANGDGKRQPRSVWSIATRPFKGAHFATFPPDLIRPCVIAGCPAGGTVLDPFFGAGTTGLVAAELGRNCIGIELNPEYVAIAEKRLGLRAPSMEDMLA